MRLLLALATLTLSLAGCAGSATPDSHADAHWRVIPLNREQSNRAAILLNGQTGDTWIYDVLNNRWSRVQRN